MPLASASAVAPAASAPAAVVATPKNKEQLTFEEIFTPSNLRKTALTIRREIRQIRTRDVVDWADWFVTLEASLQILSQEIVRGEYTPTPPTRYELSKGHGSYRVITALSM